LGKPVSISNDSPDGDTISVAAPPSVSIQYMLSFPDCAFGAGLFWPSAGPDAASARMTAAVPVKHRFMGISPFPDQS
jgi:hypothetical protein